MNEAFTACLRVLKPGRVGKALGEMFSMEMFPQEQCLREKTMSLSLTGTRVRDLGRGMQET